MFTVTPLEEYYEVYDWYGSTVNRALIMPNHLSIHHSFFETNDITYRAERLP